MKLYAMLDRKSGVLSAFHVERNDVMASRAFQDAVLSSGSFIAKHAEDFSLVALADVSDAVLEAPIEPYGSGYVEVLSASQVLALRAGAAAPDGQLSLLKEG